MIQKNKNSLIVFCVKSMTFLILLTNYGCDSFGGLFESDYYTIQLHEITTTPSKRQVNLLFQVLDDKKVGVDGLVREDFEILENDEIVDSEAGAEIDTSVIPSKIRTILLLDISSSVTALIPQIKEATIALVESKLPAQEFAIYTFDKDLYLIQDFQATLIPSKKK
jgi:hypothetical protein